MRHVLIAAAALVALATGTSSVAAVTAANSLAAHRAVYDLSLKEASEQSGISNMVGRMVYEFNGSVCEGYTVSFRFVTDFVSGNESRMTDQQTTTYEDVRERTFRFLTRSFIDQELDRETRGSATGEADGVKVAIEAPEAAGHELQASKFPTEHMIELISRAREGQRIYESRLYDGSDDGDKSMMTTTILGRSQKAQAGDPDVKSAGDLADEMFWPVTISYFEDVDKADGLPIYRIAFKLYENGVTRDLTMDYGDFVIEGKLTRLDLFEEATCSE